MKNGRTGRHHPLLPLVLLALLCTTSAESRAQDTGNATDTTTAPVVTHVVSMRTTLGTIVLELYGKDAPRTVENFVGLCRQGFYDSLLIHRVHPGFLIQGGCPKTRDSTLQDEWGTGGTSIYGAEFADEIDPRTPSMRRGYRRGTLAMANTGPNTNTSQFFVLLNDLSEWMPQIYTIFGSVRTMSVVDSIATVDLVDHSEYGGRPRTPVMILDADVEESQK